MNAGITTTVVSDAVTVVMNAAITTVVVSDAMPVTMNVTGYSDCNRDRGSYRNCDRDIYNDSESGNDK